MDKLPIGTLVDYHGSVTYMHGQYEVEDYSDMEFQRAQLGDKFKQYYPDGFAYHLWPVGVPKQFRNRYCALYFVRPESVTVVSSED